MYLLIVEEATVIVPLFDFVSECNVGSTLKFIYIHILSYKLKLVWMIELLCSLDHIIY